MLLALLCALGLIFTACDKDSGTKDAVVDILDLTNAVTAPVRDAAPDTTAIDTVQYTGTVAWKDSADAAVSGNFAASTVYKALVTLAAKSGYTFAGVAENSFTCTGATVTNAADSGTVTITFPATAALDQSAAPTATVTTVAKTTAEQAAVDFTLTNSAALSGAWKVYNAAAGGDIVSGVTAAVTTWPTLRLSHATDIPAAAYYVSVTETGKTESARLALTVANPVLGGAVSITGTAAVGETLTAVTSGLTGQAGTLHYQWKAGTGAVGTDQNTYLVQTADKGKTITVTVTASGSTGSVASAAAGPVADATTANLAAVLAGLAANTADTPYTISLAEGTNISDNWAAINTAVTGKYVVLDLSACAATDNTIAGASSPSGNQFNIIKDNAYITGVILPDTLTSIGNYAFRNCVSLTSVTIPAGVTSIGNYAFQNCSNLTSVTIPDGVTSIGQSAFENCTSLTSVTIPDGVTSIANYAFKACGSLTSVTIPAGVTSIGQSAFEGTSITSVDIPDGVTSIGVAAFRNCAGLTSVTIPAQVTSIGGNATYGTFSGCTSLTGVTFEGSAAVVKTASEFPSGDSLLTAGGATAGSTPMAAGTYTLSGGTWTKSGS
ncbi:MAG: leucine-rich repeat domain-containing protein [Treponematales bacterium]